MTRRGKPFIGLALLAALLAGGTAFVSAQESGGVRTPLPAVVDCPAEMVCVEYEGAVLEFDPNCGPVVTFIVSESLARTIDLTGTTEAVGVRGVVLVEGDAGWRVSAEFSQAATDALEGVRFGDVGCLDFEVSNDQ